MGVAAIIAIGVAVVLSAAAATFAILSARRAGAEQKSDLSPKSLDDFSLTTADEGSIIPLIYGKIRRQGNLIAYKNLLTQETYQYGGGGASGKGGGGGGGGGATVSGYRYYLDTWYSLGIGKLTYDEAWVNNRKIEDIAVFEPNWTYVAEEYNDGSDGNTTYPTIFDGNPDYGEFSRIPLPGIAHQHFHWWLMGENVSNLQTIHFLLKREFVGSPLSHANMDSGSNPAAIIYDLLKIAGVPDSKIDLVSFEAAAVFFYDKDYGINIAFDSIQELRQMINKVAGLVDAVVQPNTEGKYTIRYKDHTLPVFKVINNEDIIDLKLRRTTYSQVPNDFKANFTDSTKEYTTRTLNVQNQAAIYLHPDNAIDTEAIDLKAFNDASVASKRLVEIMKNNSYPALECDLTTFLGASEALPGDMITINDSNLGIANIDFWITEVLNKDIDKNEIQLKGRQVTEKLFDDVYFDAGGSEHVPIDTTLEEFQNVKVVELPYRSSTGFDPAYLLLVAREKAVENAFALQISQEIAANYYDFDVYSTFASVGTLDEDYPITREMDLDNGILYIPTNTDITYPSISEADLFTFPRVVIMGNEIMAFQNSTPEGGGFRLTKVLRGILNTPIESHLTGAEIWIANIGDNILTGIDYGTFYLKFLPILKDTFDPALVSPVTVISTAKAKKPRRVGLAKITRSATSTIDVLLYPNTADFQGTGDGVPENVTDSPPPFPYDGELLIEYDTSQIVLTPSTVTANFTRSGAFNISIKARRFGQESDSLGLLVPAADGTYFV